MCKYSIISSVLALATAVSLVTAATIDSPTSVVECQPLALNWHEADPSGQIYIWAVPNKDITAPPIIQFAPQKGSTEGTLTWPQVNISAGTAFTLVVNDAKGQPNFSGEVTVQKGNSQCGATSGGGAASGGAAAGGSSGGSSSSGGGPTPTGTTSNTSPPKDSSDGGASSAGSTSSSTNSTTSPDSSAAKSPTSNTPSSGSNSTKSSTKPGTNGANANPGSAPLHILATLTFAVGSALASGLF